MLVKCVRLKKIYIKLIFIILVITFILIITSKLTQEEENLARINYKLFDSNISNIFEKQLIDYESKIIPGLGDNGEPAYLDGNDAREGEKALKTYALNYVLSDRMPLNRKLRDPRNKK